MSELTAVSISLPEQEFYGPIQLLAEIISQDQLDILELSLAEVIDGYLEALEELSLEQLTDFIAVAATLILLKSRCLLPDDSQDDLLEELYRWEEKDLLLAHLLECRTFRHASQHMHSRMETAAKSVPRRAGLEERYWNLYPDPLVDVSAADLLDAYLSTTLKEPAPEVEIAHLAPIRFKVADALEHLLEEVPRAGAVSFRDIPRRFPGRTGFVIYFLAVLELWRQGFLELSQLQTFGDIRIEWSGRETEIEQTSTYGEETGDFTDD